MDNEDKNLWWYKKTYDDLINSRKSRGLNKKKLNFYTEKHHIVPRCLGGEDKRSNYVLLTYREHIIAHKLLSRIYLNNLELSSAVFLMYNVGNKGRNEKDSKFTTKELEEFRKAFSEKARKDATGNKRCLGRVLSEETKNLQRKIQLSNKSEETRIKRRLGRLGKKQPEAGKRMSGANSPTGKSVINLETGEEYPTVRAAAEALKVTEDTITIRIKKGNKGLAFKDGKSVGRISKSVQGPDGIVYKSIYAAAKAIGITRRTLKNWIEFHPEFGYKYI